MRSALAMLLAVCGAAMGQPCTWVTRPETGPSGRYDSMMAYDSARARAVLFGGLANGFTVLADTWEWNGASWQQRSTTGPSPREGSAFAYDAAHGLCVLFGGYDPNGYLGDTWLWDGTAWAAAASGPNPRIGARAAFNSDLGRVMLFGGYSASGTAETYWSDLWEWDGASWQSVPQGAVRPAGRTWHAMEYDPGAHRLMVFGGRPVGANAIGDTWAWDGDSWQQLQAEGPIRGGANMVYDARRRRMVFCSGFGENGGVATGGTWEWNGLEWVVGPDFAPQGYGSAAVFDASRSRIVRFGGGVYIGPYSSQTREFACGACAANCDNSTTPPVLNVQDFTCFINRFTSGLAYGNCDGSTTPPTLNVQDFLCFMGKFGVGCT